MKKYTVDKEFEIPLILRAKELAFDSFQQILDCSKSPARKSTEKSFDEVIELYKTTNGFKFFSFVIRDEGYFDKPYIEVSLSASTEKGSNVEYFIFVLVDIIHLDELVSKFKLLKFR